MATFQLHQKLGYPQLKQHSLIICLSNYLIQTFLLKTIVHLQYGIPL